MKIEDKERYYVIKNHVKEIRNILSKDDFDKISHSLGTILDVAWSLQLDANHKEES